MKYLRKILVLVIICILSFSGGCERDKVVAKVNGEKITERDLNRLLEHGGLKRPQTEHEKEVQKMVRAEILNQLINERLMMQAARKEKIKVDKSEVEKEYKEIVKAFPSEAEYLKRLKEKGISKDFILKSIEKDIMIAKFADRLVKDISISENELKEYYEKNLPVFTTMEAYRLSIIKVDTIEDARRIKKELEAGASFEELAKRYPAGHQEKGSDTGWVTLGTFPKDISKEISKIKPGTFGGPIVGREGFYLVKVFEKREQRTATFEEVKADIMQMLLQNKKSEILSNWIEQERKKAKIETIGT